MKIAFELVSLSEENLTGIGRVGLEHFTRMMKRHPEHDYYAYSFKRFLQLGTREGGELREVISPVASCREWSAGALASARGGVKRRGVTGPLFLVMAIFLRIVKMVLEAADTICVHFLFARSIAKDGIDVYIGTHADFFPALLPRGVLKTWIIHDIVWKLYPGTMWDKSPVRNFFIRRNMGRCDLLFAVSDSTKNDLRDVLGVATPVTTVHNAADGNLFRPVASGPVARTKKRYGISAPYILSVCTLEPRKNIETLLRAFARMERRESYQLVLVGKQGWIHPAFFSLIEELGIGGRVVLPGYVPEEDLAPLYSGAGLFAFPSLYEGFGMPVLEAMQCGCPVVTSTSSSLPEVAGEAAILVDPLDADALAGAMESVMGNGMMREKLRRRGLARAMNFSWDKSTTVLNEAILSAIEMRQ